MVAAVLRDSAGRVLLARRPEGKPLAGFWEFPGGKVEPGETAEEALRRELSEELGISVTQCLPLIEVRHPYPETGPVPHGRLSERGGAEGAFGMRLRSFEVLRYRGTPTPRERQTLAWVKPEAVETYPLPPADLPVVRALQLPPFGAILEGLSEERYPSRLKTLADAGFRLLYLRARNLPDDRYRDLVQVVLPWLEDGPPDLLLMVRKPCPPHPRLVLHLDGATLRQISARPRGFRWVSAACHTLEALRRAEAVADFALLSPIERTPSHPEAPPIGWKRAADWLREVNLPVYLLGGMVLSDWPRARRIGAQGVFGIRLADGFAGAGRSPAA